MRHGYRDDRLVNGPSWHAGRFFVVLLALLFLLGVWFILTQKLLLGGTWISPTYDNEDWRTNEGNLHTFGAWDFEAHIWKSVFIMENFPNVHWNPYWYLGMPLVKYYPLGFYPVHVLATLATGLHPARAGMLLVLAGHLLAVLFTFLLCYKVSRRIWVSAGCATFLLSNTFISLRSYGWEPITVVFLFLFPLGLLLFLREPTRPFRLSVILVLAASYLSHPLVWFSLCMTMGLYLFSLAVREDRPGGHYIWQYVGAVLASLLIGAVQFFPQVTYEQVTSGAHMGVKYLPYYQVPTNVISPVDFLLDMGNLKGPGPVILIAVVLLAVFGYSKGREVIAHPIVSGFAFVLFMMVLFYYLELFNVFPMNLLRSIQYHRIIPEFIVVASVLIAAMSNLADTLPKRAVYSSLLVAFVLASGIVIHNVQTHWQTAEDITDRPEFIEKDFTGRISFPYTDQSLSVRTSYMNIPQAYGYYEQGITNSYADEIFSVSSGFHERSAVLTYLQSTNVERLYVNLQEGRRDEVMYARLNGTLPFTEENDRYGYFTIPIDDLSYAEIVPGSGAGRLLGLRPGCREKFKETYCGSVGEEFVTRDAEERAYLRAYNELLSMPVDGSASMEMTDPQHYVIDVAGAEPDEAVVVKMTYDEDFTATVAGERVEVVPFGPDFMLLRPGRAGDYRIMLEYRVSTPVRAGALTSVAGVIGLLILFAVKGRLRRPGFMRFGRGELA